MLSPAVIGIGSTLAYSPRQQRAALGELISGFMKRIGLADHVIAVLSDKYLRSPYCMTELHSIYQRSLGEKEDFLRRVIALTLDDAQNQQVARPRRTRQALEKGILADEKALE